jgi:hypothetical protein
MESESVMGAPRKNAPHDIGEIIERVVAGEGGSTKILARAIGVSDSLVRAWFERDEDLKEQYEMAREAHMHKLYIEVAQMARSGKGNVAGIIFTLKARFKQYDMPGSGKLVDVNVGIAGVANVLVVKDHGTDEEWQAKAIAQQRKLTMPETATPQLQARHAVSEPLAYLSAPEAAASLPLPQYGPPVSARKV